MDDFKHIKVNVFCHKADTPPVYRIYVDDDLITERTFIWPGFKNYIRENLVCTLEPGTHRLTIENCSKMGYFELSGFEIDGNTNCVLKLEADSTYTGRVLTFSVNQ